MAGKGKQPKRFADAVDEDLKKKGKDKKKSLIPPFKAEPISSRGGKKK